MSKSTIEQKEFPKMPAINVALLGKLNNNSVFSAANQTTKDWFYWTNYSRQFPLNFFDSVVTPVLNTYPNLVSDYTKSLKEDLYATRNLPLIIPNPILQTTAQTHASDLGSKKAAPSHSSTNGKSFQERMKQSGITNCASENISFGPSNTILSLVFLYIDEKLPDLGHRKALLSPLYTQMGIGTASYQNDLVMVIQDFACEQ